MKESAALNAAAGRLRNTIFSEERVLRWTAELARALVLSAPNAFPNPFIVPEILVLNSFAETATLISVPRSVAPRVSLPSHNQACAVPNVSRIATKWIVRYLQPVRKIDCPACPTEVAVLNVPIVRALVVQLLTLVRMVPYPGTVLANAVARNARRRHAPRSLFAISLRCFATTEVNPAMKSGVFVTNVPDPAIVDLSLALHSLFGARTVSHVLLMDSAVPTIVLNSGPAFSFSMGLVAPPVKVSRSMLMQENRNIHKHTYPNIRFIFFTAWIVE